MDSDSPILESRNASATQAPSGQFKPRKQGENCKFDGSDIPSWLGFDPYNIKLDDPLPGYEGDPWEKSAQMAKLYDNTMLRAWEEEIQNLLVFAGLFSAIVTAFAVETQRLLQPDPIAVATFLLVFQLKPGANSSSTDNIIPQLRGSISSIDALRINAFLYVSLVLSLGVSLVAIMTLQWVRSYQKRQNETLDTTFKERLCIRQNHLNSLVTCKIPQIIASLPIILQLSLGLFFAGLFDFLRSSSIIIAIIVATFMSIIGLFVLFTALAPGFYVMGSMMFGRPSLSGPMLAYRSPQSWFIFKVLRSIAPKVLKRWKLDKWKEATSWNELTREQGAGDIEVLSSLLLWNLRNFYGVDSICTAHACLISFPDKQRIEVAQRVAQKLADIDQDESRGLFPPKSAYPEFGSHARSHLCSEFAFRWKLGRDPQQHPGRRHLSEIRKKILCKVVLDKDLSQTDRSHAIQHMVKAKWGQEINPVMLSPEQTSFDKAWLFSTIFLLRSGNADITHSPNEFFSVFWSKLLNSENEVIRDCIQGLIAWISSAFTTTSGETERIACINMLICHSSLIAERIDDGPRHSNACIQGSTNADFRSVLLSLFNLFLERAPCYHIWTTGVLRGERWPDIPHNEVVLWNKLLSQLGIPYLALVLCYPEQATPPVHSRNTTFSLSLGSGFDAPSLRASFSYHKETSSV